MRATAIEHRDVENETKLILHRATTTKINPERPLGGGVTEIGELPLRSMRRRISRSPEIEPMAIYEYRHTDDADAESCLGVDPETGVLERMQRMTDDALTSCPVCGKPIQRMISVPAKPGKWNSKLSPSSLAEKGFTQYKRMGDGEYRKTAGAGPETIVDPR